jgi:outer membrane protein OmpA-like peptidoglycan-associated protein
MSWWKRILLPAALVASFVAPAHAQLNGHPVEASVGAGIQSFDARDFIQDSPSFTGSLGYRWSEVFTWEASFTGSKAKLDRPSEDDHEWSYSALDLRWNIRDAGERATPFFLVGMGYGRALNPYTGHNGRGAPSLGVGFLYNLLGHPRTYLRFQVRDIMFRESGVPEFSHHLSATAGLQYAFRGRAKDKDLDGVRNWIDLSRRPHRRQGGRQRCASRHRQGRRVRGLDKSKALRPAGWTPRAASWTRTATVCDGLDQCADTPKGAKVDGKGCPLDTDGDGVFDGLDECENSPKGAQVDAKGCPTDADGDGVYDGLDQCAATPAGLKVDANGCPIEVSERETELLDTGTIRLQGIQFDVNKATIKEESFPVLDEVAAILQQYPALTLEIGGHTDNTGVKAKNVTLSEARAQAVLTYMTGKYPMIDATHFTVKGYGPNVPVAPNTTALGKAKNRRVEFKVTNTEALKIEREKRRFVPKDAAPAGTAK